MYDLSEIKAAAQTLTSSDSAPELYKNLMDAVAVSGTIPLKLTGQAAAMNPLLWLAQNKFHRFEALLKWVDTARIKAELPPLKKQGFELNPYQREFMAEGRLRRGRASTLENKDRPAKDKLRGTNRLEFERTVQANWKKQLDGHLNKARQQTPTGKLTKPVFTEITNRFWAGVDTALDEKESDARRRI